MNNIRDLEIVRRLLKRINDYAINLSSEEKTEELFQVAGSATGYDWVVCHQFCKFLLQREDHEGALSWIERAMEDNPGHASLHHTKGNILRRLAMKLQLEGDNARANERFDEARKYFALSRVRPDPDEYGYVTHLDMLLHLMTKTSSEAEQANLIAEGTHLYQLGVGEISEERFNLLLEKRFRDNFDLKGEATVELCNRIEIAVSKGRASVHAAVFLADCLYRGNQYPKALQVLQQQRKASDQGVLTWVKEAELHAHEGDFTKAAISIDSAKRREETAEDVEAVWSLMYWDLIIAVVRDEFRGAGRAAKRLEESNFFSRQTFPRGYIWNRSARKIKPQERSFRDHAKIWHGRVENIRAGGRYGNVLLTNAAGETFYIGFNPNYFARRDYRRGDNLQFVITILRKGLRADSPNTKPFVDTTDDVFLP